MKIKFPDEIHQPYFWLLIFAILGLALVPIDTGGGLMGEHFQFGWPLPLIAGKIGFISPEHHSGLYIYHDLKDVGYFMFSFLFWASVFFTSFTVVKKSLLPDWLIYSGIILAFSAIAVAYLFLGFQFLSWLI